MMKRWSHVLWVSLTLSPGLACHNDGLPARDAVAAADRLFLETPTLTEFPLPATEVGPMGITAGPDGNLWFTGQADMIGRMTLDGVVTEFPTPKANSSPGSITAGPDGNVWFVEKVGMNIGRITPGGKITEFPLSTKGSPTDIVVGPDGNLWFTQFGGMMGRITPKGDIRIFPIGDKDSNTDNLTLAGLALGLDGNLWFTASSASGLSGSTIGRFQTSGKHTFFPLPDTEAQPRGITPGPDGSLWFVEYLGNQIGRITTDGIVTEFPWPKGLGMPTRIVAGPDGNMWSVDGNRGRPLRTRPNGESEFFGPVFDNNNPSYGITVGPDGNIWYTQLNRNCIVRITL